MWKLNSEAKRLFIFRGYSSKSSKIKAELLSRLDPDLHFRGS